MLITCGGSFNPDAGGYADNVVVFAVPHDANRRFRDGGDKVAEKILDH